MTRGRVYINHGQAGKLQLVIPAEAGIHHRGSGSPLSRASRSYTAGPHRSVTLTPTRTRVGGPIVRTGVRATSQRWLKMFSTDRKSTRLNSSHHSISYAVFC